MKEIKVRNLPWTLDWNGWFWPRVWSRILSPKILSLCRFLLQLCALPPCTKTELCAPAIGPKLLPTCCSPSWPKLALGFGAKLHQSFSWNFLLKWSLWKVELKIRNKNFQFGWARMVRIWERKRLEKICKSNTWFSYFVPKIFGNHEVLLL